MANEQSLKGKRVAIIATDGFEQAELLEPWESCSRTPGPPLRSSPPRPAKSKAGTTPTGARKFRSTRPSTPSTPPTTTPSSSPAAS